PEGSNMRVPSTRRDLDRIGPPAEGLAAPLWNVRIKNGTTAPDISVSTRRREVHAALAAAGELPVETGVRIPVAPPTLCLALVLAVTLLPGSFPGTSQAQEP